MLFWKSCWIQDHIFIPPPNEVGGGVYWIHLVRPSVRLSVRPSVCRRHGFRSISQVCFGISISNFMCLLMVAIGRSLLIFSDVTFKMAAWWPYWIFWFPDSNFWGGWGCEVSCGGHHRPKGKTTTGSALDGAVFDTAQILAYLVHNMSRSQLYLGFGRFGWLPSFFGQ